MDVAEAVKPIEKAAGVIVGGRQHRTRGEVGDLAALDGCPKGGHNSAGPFINIKFHGNPFATGALGNLLLTQRVGVAEKKRRV